MVSNLDIQLVLKEAITVCCSSYKNAVVKEEDLSGFILDAAARKRDASAGL